MSDVRAGKEKNGSWSQVVVAVDGVTVFIMPPTAGAAEEEKEEEDRGKKSLWSMQASKMDEQFLVRERRSINNDQWLGDSDI